jgi:PAS domain S-box-containing protein
VLSAGWRSQRFLRLSTERHFLSVDRLRDAIAAAHADSLLLALLSSSGDCIKILDLDGSLLFMTEGGQRIMEVADFSAIQGCLWPDFWKDRGNIDANAAIEAARAGKVGHFKGFAATLAGTPKWWDVTVTLVRDAKGKPDRLLVVSRDLTESHAAAEAQRESEARFKTFAQAMPNQVWSATPDGQLDWLNDQVLSYAGLQFDDLAGSKWAQMVHPDDIDAASARWAQALSSATLYETEFRLRRADGAYRWHIARAVPIKDSSGVTICWIGTNTDVDRQKASEAQLKLLAGELEHRMKNTMAMVAAIADQTFRTALTKEEARKNFNARLFALSHAHGVLTASNWSGASMATVVEDALAPYRTGDGRIRVGGPEVQLTPKQALSLALSLHELSTNATKYGSLSVPGGSLHVTWDCRPEGGKRRLYFEWREAGGPVVTPPTRRGFGSRLIEGTLSADFEGALKIDYRPEGLTCTFESLLLASENPAH